MEVWINEDDCNKDKDRGSKEDNNNDSDNKIQARHHQSEPLAVLSKLQNPIGLLFFFKRRLISSTLDLVSCLHECMKHSIIVDACEHEFKSHTYTHAQINPRTACMCGHDCTDLSVNECVRKILALRNRATSDATVAMA
jgi:hypothetical protein